MKCTDALNNFGGIAIGLMLTVVLALSCTIDNTAPPTLKPIITISPTSKLEEPTPVVATIPKRTPGITPTATLIFPRGSKPPPTFSPTATAIPTPRLTAVPTDVPTPTPTSTPVPTATPTLLPTPEPTPTSTPVPTPMPTLLPTPEPTPTSTPVPTPMPTLLPTPEPTPTSTPVPTPMPTPTPSPFLTVQWISSLPPTYPFRDIDHQITIVGDSKCNQQTVNALDLLQRKAPTHYGVVMQYVGVIKCVEIQSGMAAYADPPRYSAGERTRNAGSIWYAGTIVHDACHAKLFHDYLASTSGATTAPLEVWTGRAAEAQCLAVQHASTEYWKIPQNERDW